MEPSLTFAMVSPIEAEKDSNWRYTPVGTRDLLEAFGQLEQVPDAICTGGWWPREARPTGSTFHVGYRGIAKDRITMDRRRLIGESVVFFSSSHERSHLLCGFGMSPFPQGSSCYALVWEGAIGAFYEIDPDTNITLIADVMNEPGQRYAAIYGLADPTFPKEAPHSRFSDAGNLMALASYAQRSTPTVEEEELMGFLAVPPGFDEDDRLRSGLGLFCPLDWRSESIELRWSGPPTLQVNTTLDIGGGKSLSRSRSRIPRLCCMSTSLLVKFGLPLLLIGLTLVSVRLNRPKLKRVHLGILGFWVAAWVGVLLYWYMASSEGESLDIVVFYAGMGLILGIAAIALLGFVAQAIFAGTKTRSVVLLALPLLVVAWFYMEANEPWEGTTTGIVPGRIPEGWVWHGSTGDPHNNYDAYVYVDDTGLASSPDEDRQLIIGVRREGRDYPPGRTITRDGREFRVFAESGQILVVEERGAVIIEVSSNALPEETLLEVAERVHYDPASDAGAN